MPRPGRRSKSCRAGYDRFDVEFLRGGRHGIACAMTTVDIAGADDAIWEAWESLRNSIMAIWIVSGPAPARGRGGH